MLLFAPNILLPPKIDVPLELNPLLHKKIYYINKLFINKLINILININTSLTHTHPQSNFSQCENWLKSIASCSIQKPILFDPYPSFYPIYSLLLGRLGGSPTTCCGCCRLAAQTSEIFNALTLFLIKQTWWKPDR